jgi:hypothetical protein
MLCELTFSNLDSESFSMWTPKLQKEDNVCLFVKMQQLISNMHIKQKEEESSSGVPIFWSTVEI